MSNPDPGVVRQIVRDIDFWSQWDETFDKDAAALRLFFQEHHDQLSSLFTHFSLIEAKCHKPSAAWWQRWQELRATLPEELVRGLLVGLARRNEWYYRPSLEPAALEYDLDGLTHEVAESEDGRFIFDIFEDSDGQLHFARARTADQKRGSDHQYTEYQYPIGTAVGRFRHVTRSYGWNEQSRLIQSFQPRDQSLHGWFIHYDAISQMSNGKWYDRLQAHTMTHVISHAACWALSEFHDREVCDCLTSIALAYARKKSDQPAYLFPSAFSYSSASSELDQDWPYLSPRELMAKYSVQDVRRVQLRGLFMEACGIQNTLTRIEEESRNATYYRARSATWALEQIGTDRAVAGLNRILDSTPNKWFRHMLRPTLDTLAKRRGLDQEDLADQVVPTHDLDEESQRIHWLADYRVGLSIASNGRVVQTITNQHGKEYKTLPAKIRKEHEESWKSLQSEKKELAETLSLQKARLEAAMIEGRQWSFPRWQSLFATHPLLKHLACRLIWHISTSQGEQSTYALPEQDGTWRAANNEDLHVGEQSILCLAHPVEMTAEEQMRWQHLIVTCQIVQPFKQAFREIYTLTPAEEETMRYSNRFAGQRIQLRPFNGIARGRGWTGDISHASEGVALGWREYGKRKIRACFVHGYETITSATGSYELVGILGQASFFPASFSANPHGMQYEMALPLPEVAAVVFSEAMRDLDLFLSVSSIGIDPTWPDQEAERVREVQASQEQGRMRAALLRELLPMLELTKQVRVEEHIAVVIGSYADYQIHLGSGSILLRPVGQYLCIVPGKPEELLYLPFEENDGKTMEILSKILLLAQDEQITDPTILRQIRSRR